ncbi:MAG: MarR family transcriptional regulator [Candidatus Brocadiae bacterium]|nr:MarR family transcriptional regulator [Candidatus Brocadiia bacterium]
MAETDSHRIARNLHMLSTLTHRVLEQDVPGNDGSGATFLQVVILKWLGSAGPRRAQDVAKYLTCSAPAVSQHLARLKKKGLIRVKPNALDRRADDLHVTEKGHAVIRRYETLRSRRLDRLVSRLPDARRRVIVQGLEAALEMLLVEKPWVDDICLHCGAYDSPQCKMREHGMRCPTEGTAAKIES